MKYQVYGHEYISLYRFLKAIVTRQLCSLSGHPHAKFHAATGACDSPDGVNVDIGVTIACPICHWGISGDIKAAHGNVWDEPTCLVTDCENWKEGYKCSISPTISEKVQCDGCIVKESPCLK